MDRLTKRIGEHVYYAKGKYSETLPAECESWDVRKILNQLAAYEDMLSDRTFWVITSSYDVKHAAPVKIKEIAEDGTFTCTWQVTDEYSEDIEDMDVTDLFHTQSEAEAEIKCATLAFAFKSYISDHTSTQSRINEIFDYYLKKAEEGKLEGENHA